MDNLRICEFSFLYFQCFYISVIHAAEFDTTIRYLNENTENISCWNTSQIAIQNINVHEEKTTCRDKPCALNFQDTQTIKDKCNGERSCLVDYNFTSTCLREFRYINLSYACKHENGTSLSSFEDDFGDWMTIISYNVTWKRENLEADHTRISVGNSGYSIYAIAYKYSAGTTRIYTDTEFIEPICLSLWFKFSSNCIDCFLNIYHTSDSKETLIFTENDTSESIVLDQWVNTSVDVYRIGPFNITLEAVFKKSNLHPVRYIMVDDTSIAYMPCQGKQIHTTCGDMIQPIRIECETQFLVGDIELSLEPEDKNECDGIAVNNKLNNFCRNKFSKSEKCDVSVYKFINEYEDCYTLEKNISVKYSCIDIPDGSLKSPVQYDIIGIAAGIIGGVILTIIAVVVICRKKRSTPGKPNAISTNGNKAYDDLQHDDESQQKPSLSQSSSQDKIPPNNSNLIIPIKLDQDGQESADIYKMSKEDGMFDVSSNDRHRENRNDNNIYSHTTDNIYDSGSHHKLPERNEETYDHFFGQQTDDEYDTTTRT